MTRSFTKAYGPWILCAYAIFFAGIAPFICWGTAGDPTHGHAASHFVFDKEISVAAIHSSESHGHDYCQHDPMLRHNRLAPERNAAATVPNTETRSIPVVTLISIIMLLVLLGARESIFTFVRQFVRITFFLPARTLIQPVPLPPPRDLAAAVA